MGRLEMRLQATAAPSFFDGRKRGDYYHQKQQQNLPLFNVVVTKW